MIDFPKEGETTFDDFAREMEGLDGKLESLSLRDPLTDILGLALNDVTQSFQQGKSPEGVPWPPRIHIYPHPMLLKTRRMSRSSSQGGPEHIRQIGDNFMEMGTQVPYAVFQNFGFTHASGTIVPPRTFMGVSDDTLDQAEEILGGFVEKVLVGA